MELAACRVGPQAIGDPSPSPAVSLSSGGWRNRPCGPLSRRPPLPLAVAPPGRGGAPEPLPLPRRIPRTARCRSLRAGSRSAHSRLIRPAFSPGRAAGLRSVPPGTARRAACWPLPRRGPRGPSRGGQQRGASSLFLWVAFAWTHARDGSRANSRKAPFAPANARCARWLRSLCSLCSLAMLAEARYARW